jgi:cobalt-zinc-cadmium resistance protein CzcA
MMARLVRFAGRHRVAVVVGTLLLGVCGVVAGAGLRLDALPDITTNQVLVLTRAPGATPAEVERLVTRRVELAIGGVPGLIELRSLSRYGISAVTAVFADEVDPYRARQVVRERLDGVVRDLPPGVEVPEIGPLTGGLGEVLQFVLRSRSRSQVELGEIARLRVAPLLRAVPGVVEVNTWGGARRTLDVVGDPVRMAARGVTLEELHRAVAAATGQVPGASLEAGATQTLLRGVAWPSTPADLGAALLRPGAEGDASQDGRTRAPLRVADVAEVVEGAETRLGTATANAEGEVVYVMVQMLRGENALKVVAAAQARMADVRAAVGDDVSVDVVYDRAELVRATLRTVALNLLEGGVLVVLVLFLSLGSFRAGLVVALTIPLSMLGAVAGMVLLDEPGNLMSLGAVDFGLLVDGGVVLVESAFHEHAYRAPLAPGTLGRHELASRIVDACARVARPVFFSVAIVALVYVPVLSLTGVDGKLFRPMAITVVLALATSLLLSLVFVPAAAALLLRPCDLPSRDPFVVRLAAGLYAPVLREVTSRPALVAAAALALLAAGGSFFVRAGSELVPQLDEGDLVVQTVRAPDIRLDVAALEASRLERGVLEHVPEVASVASRIGSPEVATDIMGYEQSDVFVRLRPRAEWRPGVDKAAVIAQIRTAIDVHAPGASVSFTQPIQMRFNELLGGSVSDVTVSVFGEDLGTLRALAERVAEAVSAVPGAVDVRLSAPPPVPLLEVRPRALDAGRLGLGVDDVLAVVRAQRVGLEAGLTYDGPLAVPVRVRLGTRPPTAFTLADTLVPTSEGIVPLSRLADIHAVDTPSVVERRDGARRIVVGFNVRGRDLGTVVAEAQAAVGRRVPAMKGVRLVWGGQFDSLEAARARLRVVVPLVLVIIVALLVALFRAARPVAVILLHVPFAAVGGAIMLWARDMPLSISASIGFIALSGIAVLNGVVLLTRVRALEDGGASPREAARIAATERMRPVLMTALVAGLGFLPMTLATGVGAEVQRPLASVVVGGLVTSTLLTLVLLPALYPWLAGSRDDGQAGPPHGGGRDPMASIGPPLSSGEATS